MNLKILVAICLSLFGAIALQAQELKPFMPKGGAFNLWGYQDQNGKVIIQPKYGRAEAFSEGLAAVHTGVAWIFIDKTDKLILGTYDDAGSFSEGLAPVKVHFGDKWGFIDKTGKQLILANYSDAKKFSEGLAAVNIGGIYHYEDDRTMGGKWGFIDKKGKEVISAKYHNAHSFSEGLAAVQLSETKKWGFVDKTGKEVIPFTFDAVGEGGLFPKEESHLFKNGKIQVRKDNRKFFIDNTGRD